MNNAVGSLVAFVLGGVFGVVVVLLGYWLIITAYLALGSRRVRYTVVVANAKGHVYATMSSLSEEEALRWGTDFATLWPEDFVMWTQAKEWSRRAS